MKVVYHLGWHKTGSTYLQEFFARNAGYLLREHSILYPLSGRKGTAHHLLFARSHHRGRNLRTVSGEWPNFVRELTDCVDTTRNVLVSSESMQALSPDGVAALTGGPLFEKAQAEAIVYLRRHDQFVESQYAERIKFGIHTPWVETYGRILRRAALYTGHLGRIRSNKRLNQLILRPFVPAKWKNQNLTDDFFERAFGTRLEGELDLPVERNHSPDPRVLHIVERFHQTWKYEPIRPRFFKVGIVTPLDNALRRIGLTPEKPLFLSLEERLEVLKKFSPENEKLAEWSGGEIDFSGEAVVPKEGNRDLFERPSPDQIRAILESYLDKEFFHEPWATLPDFMPHEEEVVRRVFKELLASTG